MPHVSGGGLKGLVGRLAALATTGDVSELGDVRFAVVRPSKSGASCHVLSLWSEGPFSITAMFPEEGDAPGRDSPYAPRPEGAVRVLSGEIEDAPYALRMYDTSRAPSEVLGAYSKEMSRRGFTEQPLPGEPSAGINERARVFAKDGRAVLVALSDTPQAKTGVTLMEMGSAGFAEATAREEP